MLEIPSLQFKTEDDVVYKYLAALWLKTSGLLTSLVRRMLLAMRPSALGAVNQAD